MRPSGPVTDTSPTHAKAGRDVRVELGWALGAAAGAAPVHAVAAATGHREGHQRSLHACTTRRSAVGFAHAAKVAASSVRRGSIRRRTGWDDLPFLLTDPVRVGAATHDHLVVPARCRWP